jgi:hypothetical protein
MVGIVLAGKNNWIRAVANSLRLPLNKWAVIRCHCLNPINFNCGRVILRKSPPNQGRRDERSHLVTPRRTVLFQMKCRLKMSLPAVFSGFNRAGVNFPSFPVGTLGWVSAAICLMRVNRHCAHAHPLRFNAARDIGAGTPGREGPGRFLSRSRSTFDPKHRGEAQMDFQSLTSSCSPGLPAGRG